MGDYGIGPRVYQFVIFQFEEEDEAIMFIVMEQLEMTLANWMLVEEKKADVEHTARRKHHLTAYDAIELDKLIERAFRVGLIHQDLHFSNIMTRANDTALYLIDFGRANLLWSDLSSQEERDRQLAIYQRQFEFNFRPHKLEEFRRVVVADAPHLAEFFDALLILYLKHHGMGDYRYYDENGELAVADNQARERHLMKRGYSGVVKALKYRISLHEEDWKPILSKEDHDDVIKMIVELHPTGVTANANSDKMAFANAYDGLEHLPASVLLQVLPLVVN
jgi:hypothetical protein